MNSNDKAAQITELADRIKAERIETMDVRDKTIIADYFVICTGTSDLHVRSIADSIAGEMRDSKMKAHHVEGRGSGWVLLDFGDVVCHVMREETRQFYDLEALWKMMPKSQTVGS